MHSVTPAEKNITELKQSELRNKQSKEEISHIRKQTENRRWSKKANIGKRRIG